MARCIVLYRILRYWGRVVAYLYAYIWQSTCRSYHIAIYCVISYRIYRFPLRLYCAITSSFCDLVASLGLAKFCKNLRQWWTMLEDLLQCFLPSSNCGSTRASSKSSKIKRHSPAKRVSSSPQLAMTFCYRDILQLNTQPIISQCNKNPTY